MALVTYALYQRVRGAAIIAVDAAGRAPGIETLARSVWRRLRFDPDEA